MADLVADLEMGLGSREGQVCRVSLSLSAGRRCRVGELGDEVDLPARPRGPWGAPRNGGAGVG